MTAEAQLRQNSLLKHLEECGCRIVSAAGERLLVEVDRQSLEILPLARRVHDMDLTRLLAVGEAPEPFQHEHLPAVADAIASARRRSLPTIR